MIKARIRNPLVYRRCYVSVAVLNNLVYAMGGYDGYHRQKTAERYNYKTNQWSLIAPMNVQRSDASATTLNGISFDPTHLRTKCISDMPSSLFYLSLDEQ